MTNPALACLPVKRNRPTLRVFLALGIFCTLMSGCHFARPFPPPTITAQPLSTIHTLTPDLTATFQAITPIPSDTPSKPSPTPTNTQPPATILLTTNPGTVETPTLGPCGFIWARKSLPELSGQLRVKLDEAGLTVIAASAEAYGEDCLYSDGTLAYFAAMETDYRVTLSVNDLIDTGALGSLLERTLVVIDGFPVTETPGPNPGYIGISFQAGEQIENLWFQRAKSDQLRAQGLSGVELYEALKAR